MLLHSNLVQHPALILVGAKIYYIPSLTTDPKLPLPRPPAQPGHAQPGQAQLSSDQPGQAMPKPGQATL